MKYQPRYVAYLALIGGEAAAANHYYVVFIGIMLRQYQTFRGVPSEYPITDHKEFTAFIQQMVSYYAEETGAFHANLNIKKGVKYEGSPQPLTFVEPEDKHDNAVGKGVVAQKELHDLKTNLDIERNTLHE